MGTISIMKQIKIDDQSVKRYENDHCKEKRRGSTS